MNTVCVSNVFELPLLALEHQAFQFDTQDPLHTSETILCKNVQVIYIYEDARIFEE